MMNEQGNFLAGKAAEMSKANPAEAPRRAVEGRTRIPMSLPHRKLAVPEMPGFVLRWMRGTQDRLQRATTAGYTFVERDEVEVPGSGLANDLATDGNSDMGSRVSVSAGDNSEGLRLYLMKIPQELWDEDQKLHDERQEAIVDQLRGVGLSEPGGDNAQRYTKPENRNIFQPHKRN